MKWGSPCGSEHRRTARDERLQFLWSLSRFSRASAFEMPQLPAARHCQWSTDIAIPCFHQTAEAGGREPAAEQRPRVLKVCPRPSTW